MSERELIDSHLINNNTFESIGVEVSSECLNEKIHILGVYRPPSGDLRIFNDSFSELLSKDGFSSKSSIVSGDFNACLINAGNHTATDDLKNIFYTFGFFPTITSPTRIQNNSMTVLDQIWINCPVEFSSGILLCDITDHLPIFTFIDITKRDINATHLKKFRCFSVENKIKFKNMLHEFDWSCMSSHHDVNYMTNVFDETLQNLYDECFPIVTKQISTKRVKNPWMSSGILKSVKNKSAMFKRFKLGLISNDTYRIFRNVVTSVIRAAKKFYFKNAFSTAFTNIKKTWDLIWKSTGLGKARKDKIVLINSDGIKVNESDVPNVFNEYFVNAANNLINDLPPADVPFTEYLNTPVSHTIFLAPTNPFEVSKTINSLKNKSGILSKPNVFSYKLVGDNISEPLSIIFNAILDRGV